MSSGKQKQQTKCGSQAAIQRKDKQEPKRQDPLINKNSQTHCDVLKTHCDAGFLLVCTTQKHTFLQRRQRTRASYGSCPAGRVSIPFERPSANADTNSAPERPRGQTRNRKLSSLGGSAPGPGPISDHDANQNSSRHYKPSLN